jgi:hypothetical protein
MNDMRVTANNEFERLDLLLEDERTRKSLLFALAIQNGVAYSFRGFHEYDPIIDYSSAEKCLTVLAEIGLAKKVADYHYNLNPNPELKNKALEYLSNKGISIPLISSKPFFVRELNLTERREM